jgi:hypothetical protein
MTISVCRSLIILIVLGAVFWSPDDAPADVFLLKSGGRIEGELVNPEQSPRTSYLIATDSGGKITLLPTQIETILRKSEAEKKYEEYLPKMPDTAEGNWKMADWCRQAGLNELRTKHLLAVIGHDPDHKLARAGLGHTKVGGEWVDTDQWMIRQGYVSYRGSWRVRQEIELAARKREQELATVEWIKRINMLREMMTHRDPRRVETGRAGLKKINDVAAAPALVNALEKEEYREIKAILIEALGRLRSGKATGVLVKTALSDKDDRIRDQCWDELARRNRQQVTQLLLPELNSKDNLRVNRAGIGIGRMEDATAILPLIDALTTKHRFLLKSAGNMSAGFQPGGGSGGLQMGGRDKVVERELRNRDVLNALALLTGVNFQYDKERWRQWYIEANTPNVVTLRRDDG